MEMARLVIGVDSREVTPATRALDSMASAGRGLEGVIQKMAAAWASWKVIQYARESATLAARYETLGVVMGVVGNNAGYTRAQMEALAGSLQQTGISMVESRQSLSVMAQSHIDLANATKLARLAQDAAVIGNMNSSEAFGNLIHGIQSGQTEILKTIGINVNFEASYKTLADSLHKTTQQLTEQEKIQARTNIVLSKAPDLQGAYAASMETAGKQLLSMSRYAEDAQTVLGSIFSDAFGIGVQSINQGLQDMKKWLVDNGEAARNMNTMLGLAAGNFVGLVKDVLGIASDLSRVNDELSIGEILAGGLALGMAVLRDIIMAAVGLIQTLWGGIETVIAGTLNAVSWILNKLVDFQPPEWLTSLTNHGQSTIAKGAKNMTTSATVRLYEGGGDLGLEYAQDEAKRSKDKSDEDARIAAGKKSRVEAEAAAKKKLLDEEAAKYAKQYASELSKQHEEYLKLIGDTEGLYRAQMVSQGFHGKELQILIERHRIQSDMEKQVKETAEWERNWVAEQKRAMEDLLKTIENKSQRRAAIAKMVDRDQNQFVNTQIGALTGPSRDNVTLAEEIKETNRLYAIGIGTLPEYTARMNELNSQAHIMTDTFGDLRDTVNNWANTLSNDFIDACFGAKVSFSDLVTSMLKDLARLAFQQNVTSSLSGWIGTALQSMLGSGGATGYQGTANPGMHSYAVGTDYVPKDGPAYLHQGEAVIPRAYNKAGSQQNNQVSISINVDQSGQSTAKVDGNGFTAMADGVRAVVVDELRKQQRPRGAFNPV